jgi:hypothetical protein
LGVVLAVAFSPWTFAVAPASSAQGPAAGDAKCELTIDGQSIDRVLLRDQQNAAHKIDDPRQSARFPAGKYYVECIELQGGSKLYPKEQDWFTLSPDRPYRLSLGSPMNAQVKARRRGRTLILDYRLLDADGRNYARRTLSSPPSFKVFEDGREIGSGVFKYG